MSLQSIFMNYEKTYLVTLGALVAKARAGEIDQDRTGTGTARAFGLQLWHDHGLGYPLLTTKSVFFKGVIEELLWFLRGETNIRSLQAAGVKIWDEWATAEGDLGPVYGAMWRSWPDGSGGAIDQIATLIAGLRQDPLSRRHVVSGWNPAVLPKSGLSPSENAAQGCQALPPCHTLFQFCARPLSPTERLAAATRDNPGLTMDTATLDALNAPRYALDLQLYQRSADWFLGVPFNVASYSALQYLVAAMTNMVPGRFIHTFGDYHLYANHVDAAEEQLSRKQKDLPTLRVNANSAADPASLTFADFVLTGYEPHPTIKAPISV